MKKDGNLTTNIAVYTALKKLKRDLFIAFQKNN